MGSFNTACFVSRQTIAPRDACVIVAVAQQSTYHPVKLTYQGKTTEHHGIASSTCYATGFWAPVSHFFDAVYDDYGRVTLDDTAMNRTRLWDFLNEALSHTPTVEQGENECHDVPYDLPAFMAKDAPMLLQGLTDSTAGVESFDTDKAWEQAVACWDYIYEVAQEQRMFWRDYKGVLRPMNYSIVHRAAWDELVSRSQANVGWRGESYAPRAIFERALAGVKERLADFDQVDLSAIPPEELQKAKELLAMRKEFSFSRFYDTLARLGSSEGSSFPAEHAVLMALGRPYVDGKLSEDELFEAVAPWLHARYACSSLESLNLHFEPLVYASQDYSNEIGQGYRQFVDAVERKVTRGRIEESWGALVSHSVSVGHRSVFTALQSYAEENDVRVLLLSEERDAGEAACVRLEFECTLEGEELREFLAEFVTAMPDTGLVVDSLQALPADVGSD